MTFRKLVAILIIGALGGVMAAVFALPILVKVNFLGAAATIGKFLEPQTIVTRVEEKTVIVPEANYFGQAIGKIKDSVIVVQSFSGGKLIRSGSGIILTQDGLIFTTNNVAPPEAQVFQVISAGKILNAKIVFRDPAKNIAIVSVSQDGLPVVALNSELPKLGQNLLVFSKLIEFGKDNAAVAVALVSQVDDNKNVFKISFPYDPYLYVSAVIDN